MTLSRRNFLLGTSAVVAVAALPEVLRYTGPIRPLGPALPWQRLSWDIVPWVWADHFKAAA